MSKIRMKKVFYCDDEDALLMLMRTVLEGKEVDLHLTPNPMDAYRLLRDNHSEHLHKGIPAYDLLITDMKMRGDEVLYGERMNNGVSLAKAVHKVDPTLPVMLISGNFISNTLTDEEGHFYGEVGILEYQGKVYQVPLLNSESLRIANEIQLIPYLQKLGSYALECGLESGINDTNIILGVAKPIPYRDLEGMMQLVFRH